MARRLVSPDIIDWGDINAFDALTKLTVALWVKVTASSSTDGTIATDWDGTSRNGWGIEVLMPSMGGDLPANAIAFTPRNVDQDGEDYIVAATPYTLGTWIHFVGVYDGTQSASSRVQLYIDGAPVTTTVYRGTVPPSLNANTGVLRLRNNKSDNTVDVAEFALWAGVALSAGEIADLYAVSGRADLFTPAANLHARMVDAITDSTGTYSPSVTGTSVVAHPFQEHVLSVDDALTLSEARSGSASMPRTDALVFVDTRGLVPAIVRNSGITLGDARSIGTLRALVDAVVVADARVIEFAIVREDALDLVETLARHATANPVDTLSLADAIDWIAAFGIALADTLSFVDQGAAVSGKNLADAIAFVDGAVRSAAREAGDGLVFDDVLARMLDRSLHDELVIEDWFSHLGALLAAFSDDLGLADFASRASLKETTAALALADALVCVATKAASDGIGLDDGRATEAAHIAVDVVDLVDVVAKFSPRAFSDALVLLEAIATTTSLPVAWLVVDREGGVASVDRRRTAITPRLTRVVATNPRTGVVQTPSSQP
jgi:hypothetical protein